MMVKGGSFYEGPFLPMSTFGLLRHIPGAFMDRHFVHVAKMAGADETRRLLRQCASSLLSACHSLERRETESLAAHLQSSNATTLNSAQTNVNARTTNCPPAN